MDKDITIVMFNNINSELVKIATFSLDDGLANKAMRMLQVINKTYHWCESYDGLAICDTDEEWKHCSCYAEI